MELVYITLGPIFSMLTGILNTLATINLKRQLLKQQGSGNIAQSMTLYTATGKITLNIIYTEIFSNVQTQP